MTIYATTMNICSGKRVMDKNIPLLDYRAVNEPYFEEIQVAMRRVLESGWYVLGKEVSSFEEEYSSYCGTKHCIGVSSGLDALPFL